MIDEFYSHDEDEQTQEESETEEITESETEETKNRVVMEITLRNKRNLE